MLTNIIFQPWKMMYQFLLNSMVSNEKSNIIQIVIFLSNISFLCSCFQDMFFFSFQKFDHEVYVHSFLCVSFFGMYSGSCIHNFMSFVKQEKSSALYFQTFFHLFILFFWNSIDRDVSSFIIVPQVSHAHF